MALQGPVIIVEDDANDAEVIAAAIREIGMLNEPKIIYGGQEAYEYLLETKDQPFIILCDIRMPLMNGLEFRKKIVSNEFLRRKSIPFVYFTGLVSQDMVNEAYDLGVQGFYLKSKSYEGIKEQVLTIMMYWKQCLHPNRAL